MRRVGQIRPYLLAIAIALFVVLPCLRGSAQKTSDAQVEAAYIYNFAKFIEWPAQKFSSANAPIRFCVLNDFAFQPFLERTVSGKSISGHPLEVVLIRDASEGVQCHVLYINSAQERQVRRAFELLRNSSVLTVGETDAFVEEGGVINFFLQDDQVQFRINHKAAKQSSLYLSSRLLSVAKKVME